MPSFEGTISELPWLDCGINSENTLVTIAGNWVRIQDHLNVNTQFY